MQELKNFSADVECEWKDVPAYKPIYILLPACCTEQIICNINYQFGYTYMEIDSLFRLKITLERVHI